MPELPEVETVRKGLAPVLEGRILASVSARRPDLRIPLPKGFAERLTGRRVEKLTRRAKYILAHLDGDEILLIHLGMSGRFTVQGRQLGKFRHKTPDVQSVLGPHDHIVFDTDTGDRVIYTDHRRFGLMTLLDSATANEHKLLSGIGPEPLSAAFSPDALSVALAGKRTPIKSALLDQRVVAGLGNIYVCEALLRAGISPKRDASTVAGARTQRLVPAIKKVLQEAIRAGGSTLRDYKHTDGALGYFQKSFSVYDREGQACVTKSCGGTVERIVQAGRSTFYCGKCQR
ncbi:MAG: bifunctional DNA-formamidopyrimidine glycosylase/DNA-(apurinic or apyrimidinic site) lyase [Alphaproteobacteria bacterium]|nr:bifunctional DNA-formamidopyrimidine glycosylase/DNA-(apurinic or apyrimidinic site) lyase [Alphaproteobacteria bacterium]